MKKLTWVTPVILEPPPFAGLKARINGGQPQDITCDTRVCEGDIVEFDCVGKFVAKLQSNGYAELEPMQ